MLPSLPQRDARRHETNRSFLLALKGYQDGVNHNAGYAQRRAVPAWVNIAARNATNQELIANGGGLTRIKHD